MANEKNLRPLNTRSQRKRKEIAKMGAEASNKLQAKKKMLREAAKILLSMPVDKKIKDDLKTYQLPADTKNYAMAIVVSQLKKALAGDTKAFTAIRDIVGEKPTDSEQDETDNKVIINVISADESDMKETQF